MNMYKVVKLSVVSLLLASLWGCAATQVALSKKNLEVQTRTSTAIFVDPVSPAKRKVYIEVRSGVMEFDRNAFRKFVIDQLATNQNGYTVVNDPDQAHFHMLAYVLNLEKTSPTAAAAALNKGFVGGGALGGAAIGAGASLATGGSYKNAAGAGLLLGAGSFVANALVKDVTYMLVCDVQISEKAKAGAYVRKDTEIQAKVSDSGTSRQTVSEVSNRKQYRTRIVTTGNKVNLKLEDAQELMFKKTAYAMAGFF